MQDTDWNRALDRALERFAELVGEDPELEREFARSQRAFTAGAAGDARALAERRHLEWFVCERPSDRLEGVPADVLREDWLERAEGGGAADEALLDAMLGSLASAFEIEAASPEGALFVRDVFGLGAYELVEPEVAGDLVPGDLLVGRVFPLRDGRHRLSPASTGFRDRSLAGALRDDVERLRAGRGGRVLRMEQCELETLFFRRADALRAPRDEPHAAPARAAHEARAALSAAGLDEARAAGTVDAVLSLARQPAPAAGEVTEVLNTLAFETDVDLEVARRALAELWTAAAPSAAMPAPEAGAPSEPDEEPGELAAAALRRFDEGRARGEDLEQLFRELERDLDVASPSDEDEGEPTPDFPGVVGAIVEEYLWDRERERGTAESAARELLRELSRYASGIGVFEELGPRELLDFAARWLLEDSSVTDEADARSLLASLADFCRWVEERHAHPLWTAFEPQWRALAEAVPRLAPVRAALDRGREPDPGAWSVRAVDGTHAVLASDEGRERRVDLAPSVLAQLRPGDLVRVVTRPDGLRLARVYPGVVRELVADASDAR